MPRLSHLDEKGQAHMVDVSHKNITSRTAVAKGLLKANEKTIKAIIENAVPKGDVLATARLAGIQAAKKTSDLIPLCHPLFINQASVDFNVGSDQIEITASVKCQGQTGVEMEALTAVSVAALTLYDMLKAIDKNMSIENIRLIAKRGGQSGDFERKEEDGC